MQLCCDVPFAITEHSRIFLASIVVVTDQGLSSQHNEALMKAYVQ